MNKYLKPIGIYVLIFVVILAALAYTGPQILPQRNDAAQEEYVYSDLLKELDENNVASVEVSRRTEVGDYGTAEATLKDGSVIRVDVPSISVLQQVLDEKALTNGVKIDVGDLQRESMLSPGGTLSHHDECDDYYLYSAVQPYAGRRRKDEQLRQEQGKNER